MRYKRLIQKQVCERDWEIKSSILTPIIKPRGNVRKAIGYKCVARCPMLSYPAVQINDQSSKVEIIGARHIPCFLRATKVLLDISFTPEVLRQVENNYKIGF